jgi:hypothetical protein
MADRQNQVMTAEPFAMQRWRRRMDSTEELLLLAQQPLLSAVDLPAVDWPPIPWTQDHLRFLKMLSWLVTRKNWLVTRKGWQGSLQNQVATTKESWSLPALGHFFV